MTEYMKHVLQRREWIHATSFVKQIYRWPWDEWSIPMTRLSLPMLNSRCKIRSWSSWQHRSTFSSHYSSTFTRLAHIFEQIWSLLLCWRRNKQVHNHKTTSRVRHRSSLIVEMSDFNGRHRVIRDRGFEIWQTMRKMNYGDVTTGA